MDVEDEVAEGSVLLPGAEQRRRAYAQLTELIERHLDGISDLPVAPSAPYEAIEERLRGFDFGAPVPLEELVEATGGCSATASSTPRTRATSACSTRRPRSPACSPTRSSPPSIHSSPSPPTLPRPWRSSAT